MFRDIIGRHLAVFAKKRGWEFYWCPAGSIFLVGEKQVFSPLDSAPQNPHQQATSQFFANVNPGPLDHYIKERSFCWTVVYHGRNRRQPG